MFVFACVARESFVSQSQTELEQLRMELAMAKQLAADALIALRAETEVSDRAKEKRKKRSLGRSELS